MNYLTITYPDINNGPGFRATLWIAGCSHKCHGCHNKHTWDYSLGKKMNSIEFNKEIDDIFKNEYITGLTISGGDPLDQSENDLKELYVFLKSFKKKYPDKNIWIYSGFTYDELCHKNSQTTSNILELCDILVDGPYIESLRDTSLAFRGSHNQNIIKIH